MAKKLPPSGPTPQGFVCPSVPPYILEGKKCPISNWRCQFEIPAPSKPQPPAPAQQNNNNQKGKEEPKQPEKKVVKDPPPEKINAKKTELGWVVPIDPPYLEFGIPCPVPGYQGKQPSPDVIFQTTYKPIYPGEYIEMPPNVVKPLNLPPKDPYNMILIPMIPTYNPPQPIHPVQPPPASQPPPVVDHSKPQPGPPPIMVIDPPLPSEFEAGPP